MATPFRTGRKAEVLWALPFVVDLAKDVLSEEEYMKAEKTAIDLVRSSQVHDEALKQLSTLVAPPPKRPLADAQKALMDLPRWTRDAVRFLGDYIDLLVRAWCFELTGEAAAQDRSLGINVRRMEPKKFGAPADLIEYLKRYSSFLYAPGKHDFTSSKGQAHRFTSREVVLIAFITMKLAERVKELSSGARLQSLLM
jgi:hypothetical protein